MRGRLWHEDTNFNPRAPCGARPFTAQHQKFVTEDFNPRAPCGARLTAFVAKRSSALFQPTRPLRGATAKHSADAPPTNAFQPTRPLRGATISSAATIPNIPYFNPRAPCGARQSVQARYRKANVISTHAPLAGRDEKVCLPVRAFVNFNPRAPCGARRDRFNNRCDDLRFQPTRPLRGATAKVYKSLCTFLR